MKKFLFVAFIALTASLSINAQSTDHPRGKAAYENLSPEQKAKVQEMKAKIKAMTPEERQAFFAQNGGAGHPQRGGGSAARFNQLPVEKQAEINAMKEKIKAMTPEERKAYFAQNGGRPGGRPGRG
jgi:hypothetical protein